MAPLCADHTMTQPSDPVPAISLELGDHTHEVTRDTLLASTRAGVRPVEQAAAKQVVAGL